MSRRRDHYPRFNTTPCPDPVACERLYHGIGGPDLGDCCECCGTEITPERSISTTTGDVDNKA